MADYIDRENYCKNICRCSQEKCNKSKCPIWTAPTVNSDPIKRADLIRNMNDDEMAENLINIIFDLCEDGVPCKEYVLDWLRKPAKEDLSFHD